MPEEEIPGEVETGRREKIKISKRQAIFILAVVAIIAPFVYKNFKAAKDREVLVGRIADNVVYCWDNRNDSEYVVVSVNKSDYKLSGYETITKQDIIDELNRKGRDDIKIDWGPWDDAIKTIDSSYGGYITTYWDYGSKSVKIDNVGYVDDSALTT